MNITVLFSDITNFTNVTSSLGPRNMTRILNTYLTKMCDIIYEHGGTIDKIIGDSIMVLFGAPKTIDPTEQANKAADCALHMQEALVELNKEWEKEDFPEFQMSIGMHYGPAIVGYLGSDNRLDYTAIGTTVNMASRIESLAGPGDVFFSETIRDLLTTQSWEYTGSHELKGFDNQIRLYKLVEEALKKAA